MSEQGNPITGAWADYAAAVAAKDVQAFTAIYDEQVHVFDSWGQWEYSGLAAWREMATSWFASLGDETVEVTFADAESWVGETAAAGHAAVTFTAISASGERLRSMTNRFTVAMALKAEGWKIVHEHSSLPIDLESGEAISLR